MNESMSILLATTILALGGFGLYMYKSSDEIQNQGSDEYNEDSLFGKSSIFNFSKNDDDNEDDNNETDEDYDDEYSKPRKRGRKTQKNRKTNGTSKRRY